VNKYTFYWTIEPAFGHDEYSVAIPPFEVAIRDRSIVFMVFGEPGKEGELRLESERLAPALTKSLSFQRGERFKASYASHEIDTPTGRQIFVSGRIDAKASASAELTAHDEYGNIVNSSEMQRVIQRETQEDKIGMLTMRAASDRVLQEMLGHWERYAGDLEGRLHPLYDLLEVAERVYHGRTGTANVLGIRTSDLNKLARITNDDGILNGRHPGKTPGPHQVASEDEVNTCERIARLIIESYVSRIAA
jgi:hypothetical protein